MNAHVDTFARDNLPPRAQWPDFRFELPELNYPDRLNCVVELLDRWIAEGRGNAPCLISPNETLSYAQLAERVNRIANVLTRMLGVLPGHRVLLRGPNSPMMVAAYLAVIKAGGIVVATMPLLRAKEIAYPIGKAQIRLALCDHRLAKEMDKAHALAPDLERVVYWGSGAADALETLMARPAYESFAPCDTASDDVCLIAFTSGTTGEPKGTMHFHRDILATCDSYGRHVLRAEATDRYIGAQYGPPIAVASRQDVAVEVHGALGLAGRARGESDEADIVARRVARRKAFISRPCHQRLQRVGRAAAPIDHALEIGRERVGFVHLLRQAVIAERKADLGLADRIGDLLRAQQRHGRDHDATGFDDREIGGDHHRAVRSAQQHAVAGHHPEHAREHVGDAVHPLRELRVAQRIVWRDQAGCIAATLRNPAVEQFDHAIHPIGIVQFRQLEAEIRPLRARRQVIAREGIDMRGHCCRSWLNSIIGMECALDS